MELLDGDVVEDADWADVDLTAVVAEDVIVSGGHLTRVRLTGATLARLSMSDVVLEDCELSGATLEGARLERVTIRRSRLSSLVAPDLHADELVVEDAKADGAWLRMAVMKRSRWVDCDLTGADLYSAQLTDTRLERCRLDGAELSKLRCVRVAVHGSTFADVRGAAGLRGVVIGSDQIVPLAPVLLSALEITVDDDG